MLQHVFVTDAHTWVLAGALASYEMAVESCSKIEFELPDAAALAEFKTQIYDLDVRWQAVPLATFHSKDATLTLVDGWILCRRDRNNGLSLPET